MILHERDDFSKSNLFVFFSESFNYIFYCLWKLCTGYEM